MKALSLTQPWATLVVLGLKAWETRSWPTRFRGEVAIHASKGFPAWARDIILNPLEYPEFHKALASLGYTSPTHFPLGQIIGSVDVVGCIPTSEARGRVTKTEYAFGDYSEGRYAFELRYPRHFKTYVPCRGALGFWDVPGDALEQVKAMLPARDAGTPTVQQGDALSLFT